MPGFKVIRPLVLKKNIFKCFTLDGNCDYIGHVTLHIHIFQPPFQSRLPINLALIGHVIYENNMVNKKSHMSVYCQWATVEKAFQMTCIISWL